MRKHKQKKISLSLYVIKLVKVGQFQESKTETHTNTHPNKSKQKDKQITRQVKQNKNEQTKNGHFGKT